MAVPADKERGGNGSSAIHNTISRGYSSIQYYEYNSIAFSGMDQWQNEKNLGDTPLRVCKVCHTLTTGTMMPCRSAVQEGRDPAGVHV